MRGGNSLLWTEDKACIEDIFCERSQFVLTRGHSMYRGYLLGEDATICCDQKKKHVKRLLAVRGGHSLL